jgi:hypothetical protein
MKPLLDLQLEIENFNLPIEERFISLLELYKRSEFISNQEINKLNQFIDEIFPSNKIINARDVLFYEYEKLKATVDEKNLFITRQDQHIRYLETYQDLTELAKAKREIVDKDMRLANLNIELQTIRNELELQRNETIVAKAQTEIIRREVEDLKNSLSMRITAPLRQSKKLLRKIFK